MYRKYDPVTGNFKFDFAPLHLEYARVILNFVVIGTKWGKIDCHGCVAGDELGLKIA